MKKTVWRTVVGTGALCAAVGFATAGRADEIVVGTGEGHTFAVDADTVQTAPVRLSSRNTLEKTGAGRLEIPDGAFTENAPIEIDVREGTVAFTPSDAPAAYTQPKDVMNRAVFWVEAETNLRPRTGGAADEVESWLDVRETGTGGADAPFHYPHAVAFTNDYLTAFPLAQTYGGKPGVYFRGYGSGCFMNWVMPNGMQADFTRLRHVFIVHGGETSSGHVLGQRGSAWDRRPYFQRLRDRVWVDMNYENGEIYSSRTYLNGAEIDAGVQSYPKKSVHVVEVEALGDSLGAMCFFNDRDMQLKTTAGTNVYNAAGTQINAILGSNARTAGGDRAGGEYVFEMLLFTNNLTTAERLAVSDWLNQKWRGTPPPAVRPATTVRLATNTVVETTGATPLTLVGDGCLRKIGADAMTIRSAYAPYTRSRHIDVREGTLALGYGLPLVCAAGDTVTCEQRLWGAEIAAPVAGNDPTRLVKAGTGTVTLDAVPDGVSRISVPAGGLRLAAPERASRLVASPEDTIAAEIPDADFEFCRSIEPTKNGGFFDFVDSHGWHAIKHLKDHRAFFFDQQREQEAWWSLQLQADKSGVLVLTSGISVWCEVVVPADGDYVLTFRASPRRHDFAGKHLDVMIGPDADSLVALGDFSTVGTSDWQPYSLGPIRLTAGVKQLWLKWNGDEADRCTQFDDFRLTRVAERPTWAIPNGDFELRTADFKNTTTVTADNANRVLGFVVGQHTVPVADKFLNNARMVSTFVVPGSDQGRRFNAPWNRIGSRTQFFMVGSGATLSTTFTPPAGTWRFRADFSFVRTDNDAPLSYTIAASARIGETDVALGSVKTDSRALLPRDWPTAFSVDGATPVTLTLTGGAAGESENLGQALVDNLVLVAIDHVNLLAEGGFESMTPWHIDATPKPMASWGSKISDSAVASYFDTSVVGFSNFGSDIFEGRFYFKLVNDDTVWQSVVVPAPGLYRFSANLVSRRGEADVANNLNNGRNPVAFFVAQGGVTNWLGRTDEVALTNFNEYAFMAYVPAAGVYDVGLKGQTVWDGVNFVDRTTLVDGVQFYRVETERPLEFPADLEIEVARGARLSLDFVGTNEIQRLKIGGRNRSGIVSAESRPDLFGTLSGPGAFYIRPRGSAMILR